MKPARFDYERPDTVAAAAALLAEHGDRARPLAGGQSLVPLMNLRRVEPEVIVDLNHLGGLADLQEDGGDLVIGAMVRQRELERSPLVRGRWPLLARAMTHVGTPQTRNRGTAGGSASHADPNAELITVMMATGATMTLRSRDAVRHLPAQDFFQAPFETARRPNELLLGIRIPALAGRSAFHELSSPARAPAIVAVAMVRDEAGAVSAGVSGVGPLPVPIRRAEELESAGGTPYRRAVARELFARCLRDLGLNGERAAG